MTSVTAPVQPAGAGISPAITELSWSARIANGAMVATIVGVLSYLIVAVLLALVALAPMAWGWQSHLITSGSMSPALEPGWVAVAAPYNEFEPLESPAIVTFTDADRGVMAHRIHEVSQTDSGSIAYVTKGDANPSPDGGYLRAHEIHGNVRMVVPFVGLPPLWGHTGHWPLLAGWIAVTGFSIFAATSPLPGSTRRSP